MKYYYKTTTNEYSFTLSIEKCDYSDNLNYIGTNSCFSCGNMTNHGEDKKGYWIECKILTKKSRIEKLKKLDGF